MLKSSLRSLRTLREKISRGQRGERRVKSVYQTKILITFSSPDKTVENIMRQLRHGEQRNEIHFPFAQIPTSAENPALFVPHAAIPKQLFDVRQSPQCGEKNYPIRRKRVVKSSGIFAPRFRVKIDQSEIRNAVNYHVRHGKCVIGIEKNDSGIPANGGRRNDNVFADIQKSVFEIKVNRLAEINRERQNIDRKQNGFDNARQNEKIVFDEPIKVARQARHPKRERINGRQINRRRVDQQSPS